MKAYIRSIPLVIAATLAISACGRDKQSEDILAQDSSLARDLALANQDTMSQPQLRDVPANADRSPVTESVPAESPRMRVVSRGSGRTSPPPVVRRTQSAPAPESPQPVLTESGNAVTESARGSERQLGVIASGEQISLYSGQRVCTNTNAVGDRFTATLVESVQGSNGAMIPAGATAIVEITRASRSNGANDPVELELAVRSISINGRSYQVSSSVTYAQVDRVRAETGSDDARKVATGAAIGAIAGQILGRRTKSTVIGAATGAAAGAVIAARTAHYDGCIPTGGRIAIRLTEPLYVQL